MNYLDLFKNIGEHRNAVKQAHKLALSNALSGKEEDKLFAKFDKKAFSFEKAPIERFKLDGGEYEYVKPGSIQPNTTVTKATISGSLTAVKNNMEKLQETLKTTKYRLVDKQKNDVKYLANKDKGALTSSIKYLGDIIDAYTEETEEAAE